jgi:hypothetical protein
MRLKMIACVLAVALLSAIGSNAKDDNEAKKEKSRKMAAGPCRTCTRWSPLLKQLSRKRRDTPFSTTWG